MSGQRPSIHATAVDRHKDIKPQSILIHTGSPIYTDIGLSSDLSEAGHSTTVGHPGAFSRRYCAPEVVDWGSRNSQSDVFSLGCLFVEILSALKHFPGDGHDGCYYENIESIQSSLEKSELFLDLPFLAINDVWTSTLTLYNHPSKARKEFRELGLCRVRRNVHTRDSVPTTQLRILPSGMVSTAAYIWPLSSSLPFP
jgi:serine/threonine protein kinase